MFKGIVQGFNKVVNFVKSNSQKVLGIGATTGVALSAATNSHAVAMLDLTTASNAITAELGPAITAAMPIAGTLLAVGVGWKLYKRFTK